MHHGVMKHHETSGLGERILPGVDLTLWVQLTLALALAALIATLAVVAR